MQYNKDRMEIILSYVSKVIPETNLVVETVENKMSSLYYDTSDIFVNVDVYNEDHYFDYNIDIRCYKKDFIYGSEVISSSPESIGFTVSQILQQFVFNK